ncbi:hypothetical protein IWW50_001375, partial [Coemansia erecta]
ERVDPDRDCVLAKIVQFKCEKGENIVCWPIKRLFKQCPGAPSVEMVSVNGTYIDIRSFDNPAEWSGLNHTGHKTTLK